MTPTRQCVSSARLLLLSLSILAVRAQSLTPSAPVGSGDGVVQDSGALSIASTLPARSAAQSSSDSALSIWGDNVVPPERYGPHVPAELGEKFQVSEAGQIEGIRFYKGAGSPGPHIGHLWTARGDLLASVTFQNESASGWQSANFATPVRVQPNTTYIVSYYSPEGAFLVDVNYLSNPYTSGPITLLSSSDSGGNGVYSFGGPSSFPNASLGAANFWADVLFVPSTGSGTPRPPSPPPGPPPPPNPPPPNPPPPPSPNPPPPPPPNPPCTSQYTYPNTARGPSPAPPCPPPLPPNPNPPGSTSQDDGPVHACMMIMNGVRYQSVQITGLSGPQSLDATLYFGGSCDANQFADEIFYGRQMQFYGSSMTFGFIHFWDEPATSAIWKVGNLTTKCIDYSKVPDCQ